MPSLTKNFFPIPGDILPNLDERVQLIDSSGRLFQGLLIDDFWDDEKLFWCEFDTPKTLTERVGKDRPVGWKHL